MSAPPPLARASRNFDRKEDEILMDLVKQYGMDSWKTIAASLGSRTARQCRNRYCNFLSPDLNKAPWTTEDDDVLKAQYQEMGPKWSLLRRNFPGRTDLDVKNGFGFLCRNRTDIREIKEKYMSEHKSAAPADGSRGRRWEAGDAPIVSINTLFDALPYYIKRCQLLEQTLQGHRLQVPPEGVSDDKQWLHSHEMIADHDQLPLIPEPERQEKS